MNNQIPNIPQPIPFKMIHYAVLGNKLNNTTWQCGILYSHNQEPLTWEDGTLWRIALSDEDAQTYLQGFKDGKDLHYDTETKELSLVDKDNG